MKQERYINQLKIFPNSKRQHLAQFNYCTYEGLIYLFIYLFILTLFTVDLKLLIYTKKSLYSLYSNNIELTDVNSVTEQEMKSFPKEFLKSM